MAPLSKRGDERRTKIYKKVVREIVLWGLLVFSFANAVLMVVFFAAGIVEASKACAVYFHVLPPLSEFAFREQAAMALGMKAIEFFLLAPLGYLFTSALAIFVRALVEGEANSWIAAHRKLIGLKSLATSMLLSIIAVDFVSKVLTGADLHLMNSLIEGGFFLLLVVYLVVLENTHRSQEASRHNVSHAGREPV